MWFESVLHHSLNLYLTNQYCACPTISHILHLDQKFSVMHLWLYQIHLQTLAQQGSHSKPVSKNGTKCDLEIMAQLTPITVNIMHNKCTIQGTYHHAGYKPYIYYVCYNNIFVSNNILKQFLSNMTIYDLIYS